MSTAMMNEMERLREENASLYHLIADIRAAAGDPEGKLMQDDLVEHVREIRDERDALAANVVEIIEARHSNDSLMNICKVIDSTPATSLARRDKIKQAEALEGMAKCLNLSFDGNVIDKPSILRRARNLRQQAEDLA